MPKWSILSMYNRPKICIKVDSFYKREGRQIEWSYQLAWQSGFCAMNMMLGITDFVLLLVSFIYRWDISVLLMPSPSFGILWLNTIFLNFIFSSAWTSVVRENCFGRSKLTPRKLFHKNKGVYQGNPESHLSIYRSSR